MSSAGARTFDLVMFDLDGTLVETAPEIADAVNDTLRELALPPVPQQRVEGWIGHGTGELLVQALAGAWGVTEREVRGHARLEEARAMFDRNYLLRCGSRSRLYPMVREVLEALRGAGVMRALVTNKETRFTQAVLRGHGLQASFDHVICGDTLTTRKPEPAGLLHCMKLFGVPPQRSLFVGDSSIDVATARNAGVPVWAVTYGYNMGEAIARASPDRLIQNLAPLLAQSNHHTSQ